MHINSLFLFFVFYLNWHEYSSVRVVTAITTCHPSKPLDEVGSITVFFFTRPGVWMLWPSGQGPDYRNLLWSGYGRCDIEDLSPYSPQQISTVLAFKNASTIFSIYFVFAKMHCNRLRKNYHTLRHNSPGYRFHGLLLTFFFFCFFHCQSRFPRTPPCTVHSLLIPPPITRSCSH